MAYKVLYRKYRPKDFSNLYGQDNIKKLLIDSIINDKISHAYLFSGPRGTGKTSTAKLFAKTINCENPNNGIPCNKCLSCENSETSPDIIEIDAASNNGVDEIRELRDNAKILPTFSKYKIYIIDEVHMLSQSAWNAFLKILEEPPKHVIFILATTEIQKIPVTILSRCQRFNFQRIDESIIAENILRISETEKIKIDDDAALYLALLADGSMRDALSLLDQLSKENIKITKELVQKNFGIITEKDIKYIFDNLEKADIAQVNIIFDEYEKKGLDINILISRIINYIYTLELDELTNHKCFLSTDELKKLSFEVSNCYLKKDALALLKIVLISYIKKVDNVQKEEVVKEEKQEVVEEVNLIDNENNILTETTKKSDDLIKIRVNNSFVEANKAAKSKFKKDWETFIYKENSENKVDLLSIVEDVSIEVVSPTNALFSHKSKSTAVLFNEQLDKLEADFNKEFKYNLKFICLSDDEWKQEKKKYIDNKDKKYEYIDEEKINKENSILSSEAIDLFGEDIVESK